MKQLTPPHVFDAEVAVLGGIMLDPTILERLELGLEKEDFYAKANQLIFSAIMDLARKGQPIDALTVKEHLVSKDALDGCGGEEYLSSIIASIPSSVNVKHYSVMVHTKAVLRNLLSVCGDISKKVYDEQDVELLEHLDNAERLVLKVSEKARKSNSKFTILHEALSAGYKGLIDRYEAEEKIVGAVTGFADLDAMTSGLRPGSLIVLAARPSMGKTAFAIELAIHAAAENFRKDKKDAFAIFSLEMSTEEITQRILSCEGKVGLQKLHSGNFNPSDWTKLAHATSTLADLSLFIDDTPGISVMDIRSKARQLKVEHGEIGLIVIDYLQLMSGRAGAERREQEISEITRSLKSLARELETPILVLSQLNRSVESRPDKHPMMSDLRESGAIEQDADLIMFIYRDEYYNPKPENEGIAEIIISKQRNGPTGSIKLFFQKEYVRFENIAREYE